MALVVTLPYVKPLGFGESGRRKEVIADCAFTAQAYSSGLSLPGSALGLPNVIESLEFVQVPGADTNQYKWDAVNQKVRIYVETTGTYAEASGAQTVTIRVRALGW